MNNQYQDILNSIEEFKRVFGSEYKFLSVVTEQELSSFEKKFNVKIPSEYRWFLLNVANGIVNKDKYGFDIVSKVMFTDFYYDKDEFNPSLSFNWDKKVVSYDYASDDYPYEKVINEDLDYFTECTNGQISILGRGCGGCDFIIVNGKEYGNVWIDNYTSMSEVYPDYDLKRDLKRLNFFEWLIKSIERKIDTNSQNIESERKEQREKENLQKSKSNDTRNWWQFWK